MGNASSILTQYDIEEVQEHCNHLFTQQEIVSLYKRFCQLDRNSKGFISADEILSVPEFAMNHFLSSKATVPQKIEIIFKVYDSDCNSKVTFKTLIQVLQDLTGSFMSDKQREEVISQLLQEAGYSKESSLVLDDFLKIMEHSGLKMEVEIPVD